MASICNDDLASLGVMSGHERKTLTLSAPKGETPQYEVRSLPDEHINMLGRYPFAVPEAAARSELRPWRTASES